jgi:hypothetical protein
MPKISGGEGLEIVALLVVYMHETQCVSYY